MASKILVADDSITIQKVIGLTFANEDFDLVSADNGDEALEKAMAEPPALIIADTNMPGLSGYDLCERIRATESLGSIPLILLTGTYEVFDEERAKNVGANDHLTKPFESQVLIDKVKSLLAQAAAAPPAPQSPAAEEPAPEPAEAEPEAIEEFDDIEAIEELDGAGIEAIEPEETFDAAEAVATGPTTDTETLETPEAPSSDSLDFSDVSLEASPPAEPEPAAPEPAPETPLADVSEDVSATSEDVNGSEDTGATDWDMDEFEDYLESQDGDQAQVPEEPVAATPDPEPSFEPEPEITDIEDVDDAEEVSFDDDFADAEQPLSSDSGQQTDSDDVDVFAEFEQFEASQQEEAGGSADDVADVEPIEPEATGSIDLSDGGDDLEITESAAEEANRPNLEQDYTSHYEQTFDSDLQNETFNEAGEAEPLETFTPEPSASSEQRAQATPAAIDQDALQDQIRQTVNESLQEALNSNVQYQIESAVNDAVEKAVAQVMDELRRRLS